MSRILDDALDPQRRAECEFNDRRVAAGEPCNLCGLPQALLEQPEPVIPSVLRRGSRRQQRTATTIRRVTLVFFTGIMIGQQVVATTCLHPMPHLQMNQADVHTVPGQPMPRPTTRRLT